MPLTLKRVKQLLTTLNLSYLHKEEQKVIEQICAKYANVFFCERDKLTTTNIIQQSINVRQNTQPIYIKPYRLPESLKPEIQKQIDQMLDNQIIEPTNSTSKQIQIQLRNSTSMA